MKLLFDTHLLIWVANNDTRLPAAARILASDPINECYFSAASLWEAAIKQSLKRPDFRVDLVRLRSQLLLNGWRELAVTGNHAVETVNLPPIHKDPFDRLLVAQAQAEGIALITSDSIVARYPGNVRKV